MIEEEKSHSKGWVPIMVLAYYSMGAALAAWMSIGNGRFDWRLSLLVLPIMFLAHVGYQAMAGGRDSQKTLCLACKRNVGLFRRLANHHFCGENCESMHLTELQKLAVTRLHDAVASTALEATEKTPHCEANVIREKDELVAPVPPPRPEPSQALVVHSQIAGFKRPAYRLAEW